MASAMANILTLTFRGYNANDLQKFDEEFLRNEFTTVHNVVKISTNHFDDNKHDIKSERDEAVYTFEFQVFGEGLELAGKAVALAEITCVTDNIQNDMKTNTTLHAWASVFANIETKDLYPECFSLQSVVPVARVVFGNFFRQYSYNSALPVMSYGNQHLLQEFLSQQKGIQNYGHRMIAIFEHDLEAFSVYFTDTYGQRTRVIEIRVPYSSIRRIIVCVRHLGGNISGDITFQLAFPPYIHPHRQQEGTNGTYFTKERFVTWNRAYAKEDDIVLSSALTLECPTVYAYDLLNCLGRLREMTGHDIVFMNLPVNTFLKHRHYSPDFFLYYDDMPNEFKKLTAVKYFPLAYAVQALILRGGELYDYFFRGKDGCFNDFLTLVVERYEHDLQTEPDKPATRTVRALELMLEKLDLMLDVIQPFDFFQSFYNQQPEFVAASELRSELEKSGFMRVRKVIVTPSRIILCNPDLIMGNRCLRLAGSDNMIRVIFRDDNSSKLYGSQKTLVGRTIEKFLMHPQYFGLRQFTYLCSSESQVHDHGCYLFAGSRDDAAAFRNQLGKFPIKSIPEMMGIFGQCLTPSRKCSVAITREMYSEFRDFKAGLDANGNQYNFTEGVGVMSKSIANLIGKDLGFPEYLPSCVQFRFRGYKGALSLDTSVDGMRRNLKLQPNIVKSNPGILFRPSQKTFDMNEGELIDSPRKEESMVAPKKEEFLEIVKVSKPTAVTLNKPIINILDQVSQKQDVVVHSVMTDRILTLLETDIKEILSSLLHNESACLALSNYCKVIPYHLFKDFNVLEEPFCRSMLRSAAAARLYRLFKKMKINIPTDQGRMMFAVVDEFHILKPGQVYICYTDNVNDKFPSSSAAKTTLKGPVMVTKKSATSPGDVRMFEAVDVDELAGLVDVVVFPNNGERPPSLEMASSHLDGEFLVIWDRDLFLHYNEKPFDYTPPITETPEDSEDPEFLNNLPGMMINSFKRFITEDAIGTISIAHLANSDLFGIFSQHCSSIAEKHNQAENFQTTGRMPDALTKQWSEDGKIPPQKAFTYPNFIPKAIASAYASNRLCGLIHERLMEVKDIFKTESSASDKDPIVVDLSFIVPGDESYYDNALKSYNEYAAMMQNLCDGYGIVHEGQLFSNHFNTKKRLSERDENNMTLFNTQYVVEEQVKLIFEKLRKEFFEQFGDFKANTKKDRSHRPGIPQMFSRVCSAPTIEIQKKASAFYRAAYTNKKFLSFAWCVYDVLMVNRRNYSLLERNVLLPTKSLEDKICGMINATVTKFEAEFATFSNNIDKACTKKESSHDVSFRTAECCRFYPGLKKLLFYLRKWCAKQKYGTEIQPKKLDALFIIAGFGQLEGVSSVSWLVRSENGSPVDLEHSQNLGAIFLSFLHCISNKNFCYVDNCNLLPFTQKVLTKDECLLLNCKAMQTLWPLGFGNSKFDAFPGDDHDFEEKMCETATFVIEVPAPDANDEGERDNYEELLDKFAAKYGCKYITCRKKPTLGVGQKTCRFAVKVVGTYWSVWKFRRAILPTPKMKEKDFKKRSDKLVVDLCDQLKYHPAAE